MTVGLNIAVAMTICFAPHCHSPVADPPPMLGEPANHLPTDCHSMPLPPHDAASRRVTDRAGGSWPASPACVAAAAWAAGPADAAPMPSRISGDHHSPTVVALATAALGRPRRVLGHRDARRLRHLRRRPRRHRRRRRRRDGASTRPRCATRGSQADWPTRRRCSPPSPSSAWPTGRARPNPGVGFDCSGLTACAWGRAGVADRPPERLADQRRPARRRRLAPSPATSCSTPAT